jgi:hypothetical protein
MRDVLNTEVTKSVALMMVVAMACSGCVHAQGSEHRLSESQVYFVSESAEGVGGAGGYDCDEEFKECMRRCWDKRYPWPHNEPQSGWYHERCEQDCNREYNECEDEKEEVERERERRRLKFSRMNEAIEWIKNHKVEVALGAVVIVAGVAFVLTTGGSGALVLVPLAAL